MTKTYKICTLPGDGIGPEIMAEGVKVLKALGEKYDVDFACEDALIGGCAIDATGEALPQATLDAANASDAVLLAAVGGPKWDTTDPSKPRPEQGLLGIRKALGLYTNLRPVQIFNALAEASTLKPEVIDGVDMMIVRELTGGLYFGKRERFYDEEGAGTDGKPGQRAYDTLEYREYEIERIARQAFEAARKRGKKVTSVDKANVLETSRMWREIVHRIGAEEYPDVQLEDLLVDNTAMQLISRPADFDVVVTETCLVIFCPTRLLRSLVRWACLQALLWAMALLCMSRAWQRARYRGPGHRESLGSDHVGWHDAALQL